MDKLDGVYKKGEPVTLENQKLKYKIQEEPKKNLQTYIPISTWKKMLKKMEKTGMKLSEINYHALEAYL